MAVTKPVMDKATWDLLWASSISIQKKTVAAPMAAMPEETEWTPAPWRVDAKPGAGILYIPIRIIIIK